LSLSPTKKRIAFPYAAWRSAELEVSFSNCHFVK